MKSIINVLIVVGVAIVFSLVLMMGLPAYSVWQQEMAGKAEFAKAEQNRRIKIEEAKANLEAEKLNAQAEIERAKGAAEAIRIENGSITPTYIQYLWVRQQGNIPEKVIYIPTEANPSLPCVPAVLQVDLEAVSPRRLLRGFRLLSRAHAL